VCESTTARNCGNGSPAARLETSPNEIHKRNFVWLSAARAANMYYEYARNSPLHVRTYAIVRARMENNSIRNEQPCGNRRRDGGRFGRSSRPYRTIGNYLIIIIAPFSVVSRAVSSNPPEKSGGCSRDIGQSAETSALKRQSPRLFAAASASRQSRRGILIGSDNAFDRKVHVTRAVSSLTTVLIKRNLRECFDKLHVTLHVILRVSYELLCELLSLVRE
jgi:hypothetical protein